MKCLLCEEEIDWGATLPPLADILYHRGIQGKYCPKCWDRIWTEWYKYDEFGDLNPEANPSDDSIISKYKGNNLVGKKPMNIEIEEPRKKHWWNK